MANTCPKCGAPYEAGAAFCDNCGATLSAPAPQAVPPQQPPSPSPAPGPAAPGYTPTAAYSAPPGQAAAPATAGACVQCGMPIMPGAAFCDNCGAPVVAAPPQPGQPPYQPAAGYPPQVQQPPYQQAPAYPPASQQPPLQQPGYPPGAPAMYGAAPKLVILSTNASLTPTQPGKMEYIVGREDPVSNIFPDFDLTVHGGDEGGVSRRHARLFLQNGQWYVEDFNSTNFTFVGNQRVLPNQPVLVPHGSEVRFGRVKAIFYSQ